MTRRRLSSSRSQHGFTLIELMVGVLLGLLTMLVITQVTVQAEGRKRTVSMGNDAQVNGSLALYTLQRDLQMAGYGASASPDALGCPVNSKYDSSGLAFAFTLAPVVISDGVDGNPDTLTVMQARTHDFSVPIKITENHTQSGNAFIVQSALGVAEGDMMIAVPKTQDALTGCALFSVASDASSSSTTLGSTRIPHVSKATAKWNQSSVFPAGGYVTESYLINMGSMVLRSYTVDSAQNLVALELSPVTGGTVNNTLYPQIVNMQALYGKDTDADGVVDSYDTTTPTTGAGWQQVLTVRVAVVARSNQYEKDAVTSSAPLWNVGTAATVSGVTTSTCHTDSACIAIKVNHISDWQHYRYKVYETVVPLRNVLWNS
ncbi:MAG: PilW family protein [Aquabacterium sp.]